MKKTLFPKGPGVWLLAALLFAGARAAWAAPSEKTVEDAKGKTIQTLDAKGRLVKSVRINTSGFPRRVETEYQYDPQGKLKSSEAKDSDGTTHGEYGENGKLARSVRKDVSGPELGRETTTVYAYDKAGTLLSRQATNGLMTRVETLDAQGRIVKAVQDDNFGIEWARHQEMDNYRYNDKGFLLERQVHSKYEDATDKYNQDELVAESRRERKVGLGAQRKLVITYTYDKETGKPAGQVEESDYGRIETTAFDPVTLMPAKQKAKYKYGLGSTRETEIAYTWDPKTGLPLTRVDVNEYGRTETFYDASEDGKYGIAVGSNAKTNFGLAARRETRTVIQSDPRTGLTRATKADNAYETAWTVYDAYNDGLYGVPQKLQTKKKFGLGAARNRDVKLEVNTWNGLYKNSKEY